MINMKADIYKLIRDEKSNTLKVLRFPYRMLKGQEGMQVGFATEDEIIDFILNKDETY